MITKTLLAVSVAFIAFAAPAQAALTFSNGGGDGFVVAPDGPWDFTLFGNDDGQEDIVSTFGDTAAVFQTIRGKFLYQTADDEGFWDPAGYFINATQFQLSDDDLTSNSGVFSFTVNPGDNFGFYVSSDDGDLGRGQLSVGAVPEPASWAMLIAGFGLVGAISRRRRAVAA